MNAYIRNWWPSAMVVLMAVSMIVGGALMHGLDKRAFDVKNEQLAARDARITEWIVKRNPNATIRDFAGLPQVLIAEAGKVEIDFRLIMAMVDKESQWRPDAIGSSGEIGLMQILPSTGALVAKRLGDPFKQPVKMASGRFSDLGSLGDPRANLRLGIAYLAWQRDEFGMGPDALRAYNRSPQNARQNRPGDRYAEDVALRYVTLVHTMPAPR